MFHLVYHNATTKRIPKGNREDGASATLKAERKEWKTKIMKNEGKKKYIYILCCAIL